MLGQAGRWVGASARQVARAVRRGDTSATAVIADHLDYIRQYDGIVRAFREIRAVEALSEAEAVDEQPELGNLPLAGVPVAVKENTPVVGVRTWNGSEAAAGPVAERDHEVVRRLRGAGAIVVGTTRMPELGLFATTDDASAITRNPWRTDRTPGGSSGGAAAAVAAGLVPIAHGNDGFGSVRIPAACCGIVGIKPGRGVVPAGIGATDWFGLAEHGILATTVADAAIGFSVLAGRAPDRLVEPDRLRVAVSLRSPVAGVFPDADACRAAGTAARVLVRLGHDAVRADPAYPLGLARSAFATWFAAAYRDATEAGLDLDALQPRTRRHVALGERALRAGLVRELDRDAWRERCRDWFADGAFDVLLTPALATAPPVAAAWHSRSWQANLIASLRYAPYAAPWNIAGFPGIVVPMGVRNDGLPAAVQLIGRPGSELTLLGVAGQLEATAPWRRHAPGWPRVRQRSRVA
ncbi:amidase [Planosporangium flavigriseum]|uniref:Putative amidase AmiB2 n=1 Tax=Planosporangium flavigriseum TaxID=373681 RepID=A0A8J3LK09_9ACTN|nr:amidase [Planosporangium flavigriseum]NJC64904.1 amidase [Planosporangium flavigriseum]GIG72779.1 putative amidase AmiB2 [Planosporangium flavigriseum]